MPERRGQDRPRPGGRGSARRQHSIPRARQVQEEDHEDTSDYIQSLKEKYSDEHKGAPRQRSLGTFESDQDWRVETPRGSIGDYLPLMILGFLWVLVLTVHIIMAGWEGMLISIVQMLLFALAVVLTAFYFMSHGGGGKRRYRRKVFGR